MLNKVLFLIIILISQLNYAQPVVIYDSGNTIDAQQFYPYKNKKDGSLQVPKFNPNDFHLNKTIFPIKTKELTVGKVMSRNITSKLSQPLCVIGYDKTSFEWLKINLEVLKNINAVCAVININSIEAFKKLQNFAKPLVLLPISGTVISRQFNLKHYPVLITKTRIEQ